MLKTEHGFKVAYVKFISGYYNFKLKLNLSVYIYVIFRQEYLSYDLTLSFVLFLLHSYCDVSNQVLYYWLYRYVHVDRTVII